MPSHGRPKRVDRRGQCPDAQYASAHSCQPSATRPPPASDSSRQVAFRSVARLQNARRCVSEIQDKEMPAERATRSRARRQLPDSESAATRSRRAAAAASCMSHQAGQIRPCAAFAALTAARWRVTPASRAAKLRRHTQHSQRVGAQNVRHHLLLPGQEHGASKVSRRYGDAAYSQCTAESTEICSTGSRRHE